MSVCAYPGCRNVGETLSTQFGVVLCRGHGAASHATARFARLCMPDPAEPEHYCEGCEREDVALYHSRLDATEWCDECINAMPSETYLANFGRDVTREQ